MSPRSNLRMDANPSNSNSPRRIWLVNLFFGPGLAPTGVLLESLAVDLERQGWRVEVLAGTAEYRTEATGEVSRFAGKVHRFRCRSKRTGLWGKFWTWIWFYLKVVWFTFWRRMPDVIVVQTTPPFLHTIFAIRSLFTWRRPKLILWNQDTYPETLVATEILHEKSFAYRLLKWVARWSGRRVSKAVALDGAMVNWLRGQGINDVRVIPNWDVPKGNVGAASTSVPNPLPDELSKSGDGFQCKIAYTGNLGFGHDLTPLWDYITRNPTQTNYLFLFVGEGDRTADLKELVRRNGWQCVKFWPYLPASEFHSLLNWADCGLVALEISCLGLMSPSKMHAWLGAGKPVLYLGPEGSNVTDTVRAYDCGFIVDPRDPRGFDLVADTILESLSNPAEMGERAKRAWRERHTAEVGLSSWKELLESL